MISVKENARWDLLVASSMGIRMTPENHQPVHTSRNFRVQVTSAESNVASVSAALGLPVKLLSAFVKDSPIASLIKQDLRSRGIDAEGPEIVQDGPWGLRHQINIADSGYGSRGPRVHNDRAGEVGRSMKAADFDLERIFATEGVKLVHLSGLIAALSPETTDLCLDIARVAKANGSLISFDLNHRASFWKGREKELGDAFRQIAAKSDILVGNEEDFQLCLGIEGPETGGVGIEGKIQSFKEMMDRVAAEFQNTSIFATTLREVISANSHRWGAILRSGESWFEAMPREIGVLDRIGGGDGFVGGLLYGILKGWDPEKWLQFGWASGALAASVLDDYGMPADEDQVWSIWKGNARVKR